MSKITIGTAPDSWAVWFPSDPDRGLSFPEAVRMGAMIEPPLGVPEMPPILAALDGLGREISGIIEHDLYPCAPDIPLPIAKRTKTYLSNCSDVKIDMGAVG